MVKTFVNCVKIELNFANGLVYYYLVAINVAHDATKFSHLQAQAS
nr:hypothetical protein [uncultured bacterium]